MNARIKCKKLKEELKFYKNKKIEPKFYSKTEYEPITFVAQRYIPYEEVRTLSPAARRYYERDIQEDLARHLVDHVTLKVDNADAYDRPGMKITGEIRILCKKEYR